MTVRAMQAGLRIAEVPSLEMPRRAGKSNFHAIRDGRRVLETTVRGRRVRRAQNVRHFIHDLGTNPLPVGSSSRVGIVSHLSTMMVRPPRIVLATDRLSPGGVSHFVLQLANHFQARGCQVDVVSLRPGEWDHRLVESGVDVHTMPSRKVVGLIRSADVIHCQQRILGLFAVILGARARTIEHVHNVMSGHRWLSFRGSTVVAVSNHVRSGLLTHYPRLSRRHLSVVPNGARKRPGDPVPFESRCYDIVGVGRLEEQKDPLAFLDLVARLHRHNAGLRAVLDRARRRITAAPVH